MGTNLSNILDNPVHPHETKLVGAELLTHTNSEPKSRYTCVFVDVRSRDGSRRLAHVDKSDCMGDVPTEFRVGSDNTTLLFLDSPGEDLTECRDFWVKISIRNPRMETWKFNATLVLFFADGSRLSKTQENIVLVNSGAAVEF